MTHTKTCYCLAWPHLDC